MPAAKAGMTVKELLAIMEANDIANGNQLAEKLEKNRSTTSRWLSGESDITVDAAAYIKSKLTKRPAK